MVILFKFIPMKYSIELYNSEVVEIERYLIITVLRYIHRDPVKANMVKKAEDYIWSSYNSYIDSYNKKDACVDFMLISA